MTWILGTIRVDGSDIRDLQKASLRRALGTVLQDTFLFSETVMENIRYGSLDATDDEVIAAACLANADHFIRRLPRGYDTSLSDAGATSVRGSVSCWPLLGRYWRTRQSWFSMRQPAVWTL